MIASRPSRRRAILALALLGWLAHGLPASAQVTKPVMPAKEQAKDKAKAKEKEATREPVDLNSATAEELMTLPGIGEAISRKIIDGRPHKAVADLAGAGVPARTIDGLKTLAVVRPLPTPVDINADPILRIETLPGIGPALAREIIAGRPYSSYDDLGKLKGFGPAKLDALRGRLKFGTPAPAATPKAKAAEEAAVTNEPIPRAKAAEPAAKVTRPAEPATKAAAGAKVNLNKASKAELDALPGIGPVKAQAILDSRPFATIEDVMKVKGIKEGEFAKIKDVITVK